MINYYLVIGGIMNKWYLERYVNRRDWILENYNIFKFKPEEGLLCIALDFLNTYNIPIDYDILSQKTNLDRPTIDKYLTSLQSKQLIELSMGKKGLNISLNNLFEYPQKYGSDYNSDIYEIFSKQLGRPISSIEAQKVNEWLKIYDRKKIEQALRKAIIKGIVSIAYIDGILKNMDKDNK